METAKPFPPPVAGADVKNGNVFIFMEFWLWAA